MRILKAGNRAIAGLVFGAGIALATPTLAKVVLNETVTFYSVSGKNGKEIFRSMIKNGPKVGRQNSHALATTEYEYDIKNIEVVLKRGRCVLKDFEVHMDVKYTYPKWNGATAASSQTRDAWSSFKNTVIWHEKEHVRIAKDLAKAYEKALKRTRFKFDEECDPNSVSLNWRVGFANLKNNRLQRRFDRRDLKPGGRGYEAQLKLLKAE